MRAKAAAQPAATQRCGSGSTFFVDTSYAAALAAFAHPHALSALSTIEAGMLVLRWTLGFERISRHAARAAVVQSRAYLRALAPPER